MNTMRGHAVGIDIGGTKIALGLVRSDGRLVSSVNFPTDSRRGITDAACRVRSATMDMLDSVGVPLRDVRGMGIGCPGPLDLKKGLVENPYTLPGWEGHSLVMAMEETLQLPVKLENDADAALLGECWMGSGIGMNPVVMLTFGTGVGGSVKYGDHIYRGVHGEHPEIGLMPVMHDMPADYSGVDGSLESLASGVGIAAQGQPYNFEDSKSVFEAADRGDSQACRIVERAYRAAGIAGWTLAHTFVPQCIILGGGLMEYHFESFATSIAAHLHRAALVPKNTIQVVKARLGNQAGTIGAASLWF